jgi:hypothetical protein
MSDSDLAWLLNLGRLVQVAGRALGSFLEYAARAYAHALLRCRFHLADTRVYDALERELEHPDSGVRAWRALNFFVWAYRQARDEHVAEWNRRFQEAQWDVARYINAAYGRPPEIECIAGLRGDAYWEARRRQMLATWGLAPSQIATERIVCDAAVGYVTAVHFSRRDRREVQMRLRSLAAAWVQLDGVTRWRLLHRLPAVPVRH